jgi:6-phospho-3-hexuloisomerase
MRMDKDYLKDIVAEIDRTLKKIPEKITKELMEDISAAKRIFIDGKGRSGFIMKTFAIRLMQIGFKVHVLGETATPAIGPGDLLLIGSGSGETESLTVIAGKAKKIGARLALVTMDGGSTIASKADTTVVIPTTGSKVDQVAGSDSIQPMCNLFEQSLLIFLDAVCMWLMDRKKVDRKVLYDRHANLE